MIGQVCLLKASERAFFTCHIFSFTKLTSTATIKMPKRNREQQEKHNEARRKLSKAGKKAIFSTRYIKAIQPKLIEEANKLYDFLFEVYPGKHDLTKTEIYRTKTERSHEKQNLTIIDGDQKHERGDEITAYSEHPVDANTASITIATRPNNINNHRRNTIGITHPYR